MTRIDPAEIPELYRRLGMRPMRGAFFDGPMKCACVLGVMRIGAGEGDYRAGCDIINEKFAAYYREGLTHGFDGLGAIERGKDYLAGHADGRAAWEAVCAAGLVAGG